MVFEHGMKGMQEFAHHGHQGLHFEFALGEEMLIEKQKGVRSPLTGHTVRISNFTTTDERVVSQICVGPPTKRESV